MNKETLDTSDFDLVKQIRSRTSMDRLIILVLNSEENVKSKHRLVEYVPKGANKEDLLSLISSLYQVGQIRLKRILLVDDEGSENKEITLTLEENNYRVISVRNGSEALEHLKSSSVDLIISDLRLPHVGGLDLLSKIRSTGSQVPFIILSNSSDHETIQKAHRLNVFEAIERPVPKDKILSIVKSIIGGDNASGSDSKRKEKKTIDGAIRLLLVDDNDDNRVLIKSFLKGDGFVITEAVNGEEAVHQFKKNDFDLVLMDIQMPIMDGYAATKAIRAWEKEQKRSETWIVALSAFAMKEEILKSLDAGCNAHITKPVKKKALLSSINSLFVFQRKSA